MTANAKTALELWERAADRYAELHPSNVLYNDLLLPNIDKILADHEFKFAVDAGCGTGNLTKKLSASGASVEAFDPVPRLIEVARNNCADANFRVAGFDTRYDTRFDFGICINVLNNCRKLESAMSFFVEHIKKDGGELLISIEHPFRTSLKSERPRSYDEGFEYTSHFLGDDFPITGWHRPLHRYLEPLFKNGFTLFDFIEVSADQDDAVMIEKVGSGPFFVIFRLRR